MHTEKKQSGEIEIRGMAPYLQVYDMPTAISFYRDKLGFEVAMQSQPAEGDDCDWVLLRLQGIELMLNTIYEKPDRPAVPDPVRKIGHSDVALYFGCPDIDSLYTHFLSKGLEINKPSITGYGFKAIHFTDPDGYGLCFHWPAE
ncbi:VOC family protein [Terrimonas pollutisoli]|uniref:VOC family protein n=1 Tax=Terrimonas pollutisoli TaxID=3034147 RepID=UPI0023EAECD7|nr:VOC family protein [Terrimonas sp. H1YJ31]